ncbi:Uma2 family endonuclease [Fimbriiglobus ruber]|uniref:Uma2 family endonuclease n=1 Tax=Fimbriiglobus ruber TaxID=1908690 RepID=UPI000B4A58E1|nr:Uma2 family endonuclease [Fimbriiglobus ruber]
MARLLAEELENQDHYEIVDGSRVEMPPMSAEAQFVASRLAYHLSRFGIESNLGEACVEVMIELSLPAERNRRPDVIFIPYSRWKKNSPVPATNAWDVLPDLCVEVVSPHDLCDDLMDKIGEYFRAGVRLVWVVYPRHQLFYVYESPTKVYGLTRTDILDGGAALPGFKLPLADFFPEGTGNSTQS